MINLLFLLCFVILVISMCGINILALVCGCGDSFGICCEVSALITWRWCDEKLGTSSLILVLLWENALGQDYYLI